jgi:outer membrane protein TolC
MKNLIIIAVLISNIPVLTSAQNTITIDSCIEWAYINFEYERQADAYRESAALADKNVVKNWYPKFLLDANATYQNENIELALPENIPGFTSPVVPLNFNRVLINFNQAIYDGSVTAHQRKLEQSKYSILEQKTETEKIKLKSKVIGIYMSILLTSDNIAILKSKKSVITERLKVLRSAMEFGTVTPVSIKSLEAETLKIEQQIIELNHTRKSLFLTLSELTGKEITESFELLIPSAKVNMNNNVESRPEIQLYNKQFENFEIQKKMIGTARNVQINAFGNIGAGYPGYNIFKDEISMMALVGLKLQWNIIDYEKVKNEKRILSLNQNITLSEQDRLRTQLVAELKTQQQEINKMQELLASDDQMVALRSEITKIKASELENGTITSTDYITELNLEEEAKLNQKIHQLKLILSKLNYLTIQGN